MATIVNGTNMTLSIDDTSAADYAGVAVIAAATSCTLTLTVDVPEVSIKGTLAANAPTTGGVSTKHFVGLSTSWTMDAEVFYSEDAVPTFATMFIPAYGDGTTAGTGNDAPTVANYPRQVWVKFLGNTAGDYYEGAGYITSMTATGGTEDASTYSISIQGTGALNLEA
tara:strand:+ start:7939 stop:8442 length:504 start_codon:yes stop_codon:yes gene_type:complete